jgi:hypothetical protein
MKNLLKKSIAVIAVSITMAACTSDEVAISGTGNLNVEFDNAFGSNDLILSTQENRTSNAEVLKINKVKYIISNIVLTDEDGTTFKYPKNDSYFIIDEATPASLLAKLENVPAGNYTKIKFGIGVDQQQFELGATGQGDLLANAQAAGLTWSWAAGYKFVVMEGSFTSPTVANSAAFKIHTGKSGSDYNYTEVTLDLPSKALVRNTISPVLHIITDVSKILDGVNKIKLSDNNPTGTSADIMFGSNLPLITTNVSGMFRIDHVHND